MARVLLRRRRMKRLVAAYLGVLTLACGSVSVAPDAASTGDGSGLAGSGGPAGSGGAGMAGSTGAGGGATAGITGTGGAGGCSPGQVWCPGCTPGTGSCGNACTGFVCPELDAGIAPDAASGGSGGTMGAAGRGGAGGGAAGRGGGGAGGSAGGRGGAGAGGAAGSPCVLATMLDPSCTTAADCVAVMHVTNCCGGQAWIGVRAGDKPRFDMLEATCRQSYPACGCFDGRNGADDGSRIPENGTAAVTCDAGICKTYSPACGRLCPVGTSCLTCTTAAGVASSTCILQCNDATMCMSGSTPRCLRGSTIGLCAPEALACEMPN